MRQRQTIVYVSHTGSWGGGAESVLAAMIGEARRQNYAVQLICPPGSLHRHLSDQCDGCHLLSIPWLQRTKNPLTALALIVQWLVATIRMLWLLLALKPLAVHANSGVSALLCAAPCTLLRRALIWHQHDIVPSRAINRTVLGTCARMCSSVVATSYAVRASLLSLGIDQGKLRVIHPCVDQTFLGERLNRDGSRIMLGLSPHGTLITVIGRLVPRKGQALFLQAFEGIVERHPDAHALLVGHTPVEAGFTDDYEIELKHMSRSPGLQGHVTFLGHTADSRRVLAASDVLVVPSAEEPFGIVIIEAFASNVPVVATAAGGPLDIIENRITGLLVPPGDAESLEGAIEALLLSPTLGTEISSRAKTRVHERFTPTDLGAQLRTLYSDLSVGASQPSARNAGIAE